MDIIKPDEKLSRLLQQGRVEEIIGKIPNETRKILSESSEENKSEESKNVLSIAESLLSNNERVNDIIIPENEQEHEDEEYTGLDDILKIPKSKKSDNVPPEQENRLSDAEMLQLTIQSIEVNNINRDLNELKLKQSINKAQVDFIKSKLESLEKDKVILDYMTRDKLREKVQATEKYSEINNIVKKRHGIKSTVWGYDPESGEITENTPSPKV